MLQFCIVIALACGPLSKSVWGQIRDGFEIGEPRMQLWKSDAVAEVTSHEMSTALPHTGLYSEAIEINCGSGSYLRVVYPIQPAALIPELNASVFLRSAVGGLRVGFRVVLPRSVQPLQESAQTVVILGQANEGAGKWSFLRVQCDMAEYEQQLRVLSRQLGYRPDAGSAYIDAIVFDIYNGPGATLFQIDDLAVDNIVTPSANIDTDPTLRSANRLDAPRETIDMETQLQRLRRSVPRWVQYHNESPEWLSTLGFNGLLVDSWATPTTLQQVSTARMNTITAIPPSLLDLHQLDTRQNTITSWFLAAAADSSVLDAVQQEALRSSNLPEASRKPRFVEVMEAHSLYSRMAEIVALPIPLATTVNSRDEADRILSNQLTQVTGRSLPLASVVLEPPVAWTTQRRYAHRVIRKGAQLYPFSDSESNLLQARLSVLRSIALGVKGILYRSTTALDTGREAEMMRAATIQAINAEIELLKPWIESGQKSAMQVQVDNALYHSSVLSTNKSSLIMLMTNGPYDQIAALSPQGTNLGIIIPRRSTSERAYRITNGALESVPLSPRPEGWGVFIEQPAMVELIVLVNDGSATEYLQRALSSYGESVVASRLQAASQQTALAQQVLLTEGITANDPRWIAIQTADAELRKASNFISKRSLADALKSIDQSMSIAAAEIRNSWLRALADFDDPRSAVLLCDVLSLPEHWQLQSLTRQRTWEQHLVPVGTLDNLVAMTQAGWQHQRRHTDRIAHRFEIVDGQGEDASPALQISAQSIRGETIPGGFAGSTMQVLSPEIQVPTGRLMRLAGRIRIDQGSEEPLAGALVYASKNESSLGQPIAANLQNQGKWQSFELYRLVLPNQPIQLVLELRGGVSATVDNITLHSIVVSPTQNYITTPDPSVE